VPGAIFPACFRIATKSTYFSCAAEKFIDETAGTGHLRLMEHPPQCIFKPE
jgi:hypothetical protein